MFAEPKETPMYKRLLIVFASCMLMFFWISTGAAPAAVSHYVYVFPPGHVVVYDMDNNFALVKDVLLPATHTQGAIGIRGAVASGATGMLYVSYGGDTTGGSMLKYDLTLDSVIWTQTYSFGVDSMSISPDGQRIYMPTGEGAYTQGIWEVIDANTGSVLGQINSGGGGPHNTITSLNGAHVYMGPRYTNNLVLGDTSSLSVIRNIGPVSGGVRPFTINSEETFAFITTSGKVGFYVGDINTGQLPYWVCPPGFCWTSGSFNNISGVSHGVSLSPDEKELYLIDLPYNHVHVFDVTGLPNSPPVDVADIPLSCTLANEGWLQHSRDGRFVFVGNCGDVIDTSTHTIVANMSALAGTRIWNEVDFTNGVPSFSPLSRNQGGYVALGASNVSLTSSSLTFVSQTVGTTSSAQTVTLSNNGSSALSVTGIAVTGANSGDFLETNTCGSSVAAGGNCAISVTFTPTATGTRTASVTITDSDPSSPQTVGLTGTGAAGTTTASASPGTLTYASQTVGTTSGAQAVTLSNTGSAALTISSIAVTGANSGDFLETNTCGSTVAAGGSCGISVTFKPTGAGTRTGTLTISDNATGGPQTVSLTGTGAAGTTTASASPGTLTYASQTVGTTSGAQAVTLSNTGSAALTISSIAVTGANSGDFLETNTCGNTVAGGGSCGISVTFKPTGAGTRTGTLTISDNATGGPQTVSLTGTGAAGTTTASASPGTLTYASQTVGTTSGAQAVTLSNTGSAALTISSIAVTGANSGDFLETNTCGSTVAGGGSCGISVTFKPTGAGTRTGTLTISDNATGGPQTVSLTGTGAAASGGDFTLSSSPSSLAVTSGQTGSLTVSVSSSGGFNQAVSLSCQGAPQAASCTVNPGSLTPTGTGMVSANVKVTTTAYTMGVPEQGPQWVVPPRGGAELLRVVTVFVLLMLAGILGKKERVRAAVGVAALGVMLVGSGCAGIAESKGSGGGHSGTPPGSYTLTLTGTAGTGANAITHSTTVTLMVQ